MGGERVMESQQVGSTRSPWVLGAIAVAVGVVLGAIAVVVFWPDGSGAEAVTLARADEPGADPFTESVQTGAVLAIEEPAVEAAGAVRAELPPDDTTSVLVATGTEPGLYGGSGDLQVCDATKLVGFLNENPDKAAAFSGVLGIAPDGIAGYVASLTPVVLLSDTLVTNHGFQDGQAVAFTSVLEAGTAVMVDPQGVPRVKCNCGNPLSPPKVVPTADWDVEGNPWEGFDTASVTGVVGGDTVEELTLCDLVTGERYTVPVGSRPAPSATTPATATPTTATPTTTTPTPTTPAPVAAADLRGVDWRNRTYALGNCPGTEVTLRDGRWEDPAAGYGVQLVGVLYGDLNGDGTDDALVKLECQPLGGNAYPATPNVAFTSDGRGPVQLGAPFNGADATIVGDAVQTTEMVWGPNDPRCCPSTTRTDTWRYRNGAWGSS
jgi:hypothetical protein